MLPRFPPPAGKLSPSTRKHLHFCAGFAILYKFPILRGQKTKCAVVAQLDRALDSDSKGQRFESPRPHQKRSLYCSTATFFIFLGSVLVNPLLTLRDNIGHDRHEKTDKIAHGISFPCWFYTLGSTRAILSVLFLWEDYWFSNLRWEIRYVEYVKKLPWNPSCFIVFIYWSRRDSSSYIFKPQDICLVSIEPHTF